MNKRLIIFKNYFGVLSRTFPLRVSPRATQLCVSGDILSSSYVLGGSDKEFQSFLLSSDLPNKRCAKHFSFLSSFRMHRLFYPL